MKTLLIILVLMIPCGATYAQKLTETYLKKTPPLPKDSCGITSVAVEQFTQSVRELTDQLDEQISALNEKMDEQASENEALAQEAAIQQMTQQYGMSPEQINKIKSSDGMSEADKDALANQVVLQQTNMSMEDIQKLSKMSEADKKAFASAYGTEMMASDKATPKQQSTNKAAAMYELASEQKAIVESITASSQKIGILYANIENDASGQEMLDKIDDWHNKLTSLMGIDYGQGKQMDSLAVLIKNEQIRYCEKFSPKYRSAIRQHMALLKSSLPDYQRLGELSAELAKAQVGIVTPPECNELSGLKAIKEYLNKLVGAYKFNLWFPDSNL